MYYRAATVMGVMGGAVGYYGQFTRLQIEWPRFKPGQDLITYYKLLYKRMNYQDFC